VISELQAIVVELHFASAGAASEEIDGAAFATISTPLPISGRPTAPMNTSPPRFCGDSARTASRHWEAFFFGLHDLMRAHVVWQLPPDVAL